VLAHVATPVLNAITIRVAFKITQLSKFLKKNPWDIGKFREKLKSLENRVLLKPGEIQVGARLILLTNSN
jgi:hypothetical protein